MSEPRESTPREQLLVTLAGRILALPEDAPLTVAVDGMSAPARPRWPPRSPPS